MRKSETDKTWLEPVLRRGLRRVQAPNELWDRVVLPRVEVRPRSRHGFVWMLAAASALALSVLAVGWGYYPGHVGIDGTYPRGMEFESSNALDIRTWVRDRTGLDVPLLAQSELQFLGARTVESGTVEVRYRASNQDASLRVSKYRIGLPQHKEISGRSAWNATSVSWTMADQAYTLAVGRADSMHLACLVCHTDSTI